MAADSIYVRIDDEVLSSCFVDSNYSVTSTGLTIMRGGNVVAEWTYSGSNHFLGFSNTQGSTTAEYGVGSTGYLYDMQPTYGTLYLYSVSGASKLVDNIALSEFLTKSKQLFYHSSNPPPYTGLQTTSNLVTSISSSSTDTQYPSAKCVYDAIANAGGGVTTTEVANATGTTLEITSSGGGSSDSLTLTITSTIAHPITTYSVPKSQIDSIVANKPLLLRVEDYSAASNTTTIHGYLLNFADTLGTVRYLPANSIYASNEIVVTSSSFTHQGTTFSYNSSTDCYEYTSSGGGND